MIEHVEYYQFGFYAPNTHLEPEPDIISRLLEAFKNKGFIPTTIQELQVSPAPTTRLQLQFTSPNGEWNVAFEPNRVLLKKVTATGTEIGSPEDFAKNADEIFRCLLGVQQFVGTRLSYATKGWLPDMPDGKLIDFNKRVFNVVPFYMKYPPYEWAARNVAKYDVGLGDKTEALNVITNINRIQGTLTQVQRVRLLTR